MLAFFHTEMICDQKYSQQVYEYQIYTVLTLESIPFKAELLIYRKKDL